MMPNEVEFDIQQDHVGPPDEHREENLTEVPVATDDELNDILITYHDDSEFRWWGDDG